MRSHKDMTMAVTSTTTVVLFNEQSMKKVYISNKNPDKSEHMMPCHDEKMKKHSIHIYYNNAEINFIIKQVLNNNFRI